MDRSKLESQGNGAAQTPPDPMVGLTNAFSKKMSVEEEVSCFVKPPGPLLSQHLILPAFEQRLENLVSTESHARFLADLERVNGGAVIPERIAESAWARFVDREIRASDIPLEKKHTERRLALRLATSRAYDNYRTSEMSPVARRAFHAKKEEDRRIAIKSRRERMAERRKRRLTLKNKPADEAANVEADMGNTGLTASSASVFSTPAKGSNTTGKTRTGARHKRDRKKFGSVAKDVSLSENSKVAFGRGLPDEALASSSAGTMPAGNTDDSEMQM